MTIANLNQCLKKGLVYVFINLRCKGIKKEKGIDRLIITYVHTYI